MLNDLSLVTTIAEEGDTEISQQAFNSRYGFPGLPVVLRGSGCHWPATELWGRDYLEKICGDKVIDVARSDEAERKATTISDYLEYMDSTEDVNPFYLKSQFHLYTILRDHYTVPDFFQCWYDHSSRKKFTLSWIYMGPRHSYSGLHLDVWNTSAWNAVISGLKLWLFFPVDQACYLYDGKVNPFDPDFSRYPTFKEARPLTCVQRKGDIVYTPSGWWHAVLNLEGGISITGNFMNESNYKNVLTYFKDRGLSKGYKSMMEIVNKNERTNLHS